MRNFALHVLVRLTNKPCLFEQHSHSHRFYIYLLHNRYLGSINTQMTLRVNVKLYIYIYLMGTEHVKSPITFFTQPDHIYWFTWRTNSENSFNHISAFKQFHRPLNHHDNKNTVDVAIYVVPVIPQNANMYDFKSYPYEYPILLVIILWKDMWPSQYVSKLHV